MQGTSRRTSSTTKRPDVLIEARGRWSGLLSAIGVEEKSLSGKHGPCPIPGCGGKDRFRFDDKEGRGTYFCSHCGAGDGIKLFMLVKGVDFKPALDLVRELLPLAPAVKIAKERSARSKAAGLRSIWERARDIKPGGPVDLYLGSRLIVTRPDALREAVLPYYEDGRIVAEHPAMVARITTPDGKGASLHITYVTPDGRKAGVESPKKVMAPVRPMVGGAVRLFECGDTLGVAEGIETSLSAHELFGVPVWPTLNTEMLAGFEWPPSVKRLLIFGDHDVNYAGHKAAYALAYRAHGRGLAVEVKLPGPAGEDWNDVLVERRARKAA
jgi:putative DNA primase/helicase